YTSAGWSKGTTAKPASSKDSRIFCVSYWLTLQPRVVKAAVGIRVPIVRPGSNEPAGFCQTDRAVGVFSTSAWNDVGPEALILSPLSLLYAGGWMAYQSIYALGLKKPAKPHTPIVVVGSLLAAGPGKNPVSIHVAARCL